MTIIQSLLSPTNPFSPSTISPTSVQATGGDVIVTAAAPPAVEGGLGYKYHIFYGPGTFTLTSAPASTVINYVVVAGGGGGGAGGDLIPYGGCGAGGGGGGIRSGGVPVTAPRVLSVTVGAGGAGGVNGVNGSPSGSSSFRGYGFPGTFSSVGNLPPAAVFPSPPAGASFTSYGGGGGASRYLPKPIGPGDSNPEFNVGSFGGSGGGSVGYVPQTFIDPAPPLGYPLSPAPWPGGLGNYPPIPYVYTSQGNNGGPFLGSLYSQPTVVCGSGGGGGATAGYRIDNGGINPNTGNTYAGRGGNGLGFIGYGLSGYVGTPGPGSNPDLVYLAGGGSGGVRPWRPYPITYEFHPGGIGGGGGSNPAIVNTGGGGAGATGTNPSASGQAGAPGIVIIYYSPSPA